MLRKEKSHVKLIGKATPQFCTGSLSNMVTCLSVFLFSASDDSDQYMQHNQNIYMKIKNLVQ